MSELLKRSLTGFTLVTVMIAAIALHPISSLLLFILITFFALHEFYGLMQALSPISNRVIHSIAGTYVVLASTLGAMHFFTKWLILPYLIYIIFLYINELYKHKNVSILNVALAILGHLYIALPFALLGWFGYILSETYQPILILALFITIKCAN